MHFTGDTRPDWETLAFEAAFTPAEGEHRRALRQPRHRQLLRQAPAPRTCTSAGCSSAPSSPSTACTPTTATGCRGSTATPAAARPRPSCGCARPGALPVRDRAPGVRHRPADRRARSTSTIRASAEAYTHDTEYLLGDKLLVAPVTTPGPDRADDGVAAAGHVDGLLHRRHLPRPGDRLVVSTPDRMPVFARAGAILPLAPYADNVASLPDALTLKVFPHGRGDDVALRRRRRGAGLPARRVGPTPVRYSEHRRPTLRIGPARGTYPGQPATRDYTAVFVDVDLSAPRDRRRGAGGLQLRRRGAHPVGSPAPRRPPAARRRRARRPPARAARRSPR